MKTILLERFYIDETTIKSSLVRLKIFQYQKNPKKEKNKRNKKKRKRKKLNTSATPFIGSHRLESEKNQAEIVPWKSHRSTGSHPREYPSPLHSSPPSPSYSNRNGMRFAIFFPVTAPWRGNSWLVNSGERARWKK